MIKNKIQPDLTGNASYLQPLISLYNEDCRQTMKRIPDGSVDLMVTDMPYGVTQNEWDNAPNLAEMWPEWERIVKPTGAFIFTAQQPFVSDLIITRRGLFRYDLIWEKGERATGFLNANKMPLRSHEHILVFYRELPTYNPQFSVGKPTHKKGKPQKETNNNYGSYEVMQTRDYGDQKFPKSIVCFDRPHPPIHPTQKPVDLMRYLILTYSNKGDVVFDGYSGSGTTAHACLVEGRKFVGSELDKGYYERSVKRLKCVPTQLF